VIDERGYVAEALLERLHADGIAFRYLGDAAAIPDRAPDELDIAVPRHSLAELPRFIARFAQDFDFHLVELERTARDAWRAMLAWTDEVGRPRFLGARFFVAAEEGVSPAALFISGLMDAVERGALGDERGAWLANLYREDPHGVMSRIVRCWRDEPHARLIANAARQGNWVATRARLPELWRGLRRWRLPRMPRSRPAVFFTGRDSAQRSNLMVHVQGRLAPLHLQMYERQAASGFRVVFDGPPDLDHPDALSVTSDQPMPAMVVQVERAILRWLECRIERRYPDAVVGANPFAARLLQLPVIGRLAGVLLGSRLECRLRSPLLMPVPSGIVIERGVQLGSRVTIMHQVTIGRKDPVVPREHGGNLAVIEDNVFIGAGAKVLGPVRIGRGATVGANAVVTRDVPSHCTVVGANRILGADEPRVAARRREEEHTVVNT